MLNGTDKRCAVGWLVRWLLPVASARSPSSSSSTYILPASLTVQQLVVAVMVVIWDFESRARSPREKETPHKAVRWAVVRSLSELEWNGSLQKRVVLLPPSVNGGQQQKRKKGKAKDRDHLLRRLLRRPLHTGRFAEGVC
uniref:Putative secreted peptide n=1 Tax=Anopheles braziliensis TaxID=58242 RepID=A0A2M3ZTK2_9DIPT